MNTKNMKPSDKALARRKRGETTKKDDEKYFSFSNEKLTSLISKE